MGDNIVFNGWGAIWAEQITLERKFHYHAQKSLGGAMGKLLAQVQARILP